MLHITGRIALPLAGTACFVVAVAWAGTAARGQCAGHCAGGQHGQGAHADPGHGGEDHSAHQQSGPAVPSIAERPPHGGQMASTESLYFFEVVYLPDQTRVYLYGPAQEPLSARGVRGQVVMRVGGQTRDFRFPLKHVAPPGGSKEQDYLAATVDVSRVRDGDMTATFQLENLPYRQHAKASFAQTFALTKKRPAVTVAMLEESDRDRLTQQQVCPVTGASLGSMGKPIKVTVKGETVFLCCRGCEQAIRKDPDKYLAKLSTAGQK